MGNITQFGQRGHSTSSKKPAKKPHRMFFDPMVFILEKIKTHFDAKAYLTHNEVTGQRVIRYRHVTGKRLSIGNPFNSRLVYDFSVREMDEEACEKACLELGQVQ